MCKPHTGSIQRQIAFVGPNACRAWIKLLFCSALLLTVFAAGSSHAQDIPDSKGTEFWVTFPPNWHNNLVAVEDSLYIYIAADEVTSGRIDYVNMDGDTFTEQFTIDDPSEVYQFQVRHLDFELQGFNRSGFLNNGRSQNEEIARQAFHITTDNEVTVYGLNMARTTSDAFMALPQDVLGRDYRIMSYASDMEQVNGQLDFNSTPSQFAIIATEDNTEIIIEPSTETHANGLDRQTVDLNRGDVYLVQARFDTDNLRRDLTGSRVTSNAPIAVFAGHQRATLPVQDSDVLISRDYLIQQMLPTNTWGRNAFVVPLPQDDRQAPEGNDLYRVLASADGTRVLVNGTEVATLDAGEFFEANISGALEVEANNAVQVAQFKKTSNNDFTPDELVVGDPFMLLLPPKEQFLKSYRCVNAQALQELGSPPVVGEVFTEHIVTVIAEEDDRANVRLDGAPVDAAAFARIGQSDFWFAHLEVEDGVHTLSSDEPFGLYVVGYGAANSYAYIGGLGQETIDCAAEVSPSAATICRGEQVQLEIALSGFDPSTTVIEWTPPTGLSDPTIRNPIASPTETTDYDVIVRDEEGCFVELRVRIEVRPLPTVELDDEVTICQDGSVLLEPEVKDVDGVEVTYTWTPAAGLDDATSKTPRANPRETTTYYLVVSAGDGCETRDSIIVTVAPEIMVDAGPNKQLCGGESVILEATTDAGNGAEIRWTPADGLSSSSVLRPTAQPTQTTTYRVEIRNGDCVSEDEVTVEVFPAPRFTLPKEIVLCIGDETELTPEDVAGQNLRYQWNPVDGLDDPTARNPKAAPLETITYRLTVQTADGCSYTDSIEVIVESCEGCDEIGGIVNTYHAVQNIVPASGRVTVADTAGLRPGVQVLLIQMQGAQIVADNDPSYGNVTSLNGAGLYEFAVISSINEFDVRFEGGLINNEYDVSGKIQMITVPEYGHILVTSDLTCKAWDGETGGVLALNAECLMLEADVNVDGRGFRGAEFINYPPCNVSPHRTDYVTDEDCFYSLKGEGVAEDGIGAFRYGRGSPANAGGGGNNHNAGGGGGASLGEGGNGGFGFRGVVKNRREAGGIGGKSLYNNSFQQSRHAFAGGGGGSGHSNHRHGSGGANGGGIVIIQGGTLKSSGPFGIYARGAKAEDDFSTINPDGLGGGGGGGSVLLDVEQVVSTVLVDVTGGKGGSKLGNEFVTAGPGGGGGGGMVGLLARDEGSRLNLSIKAEGGEAGDAIEGGTYGAEPGAPGGIVNLLELRGNLADADFGPCRGCYPVLVDSTGGCGAARIRFLDAGARIQTVELVAGESANTRIEVSGLGSISAFVDVLLNDEAQDGTAQLIVSNSTGRSESFTIELRALPAQPTITLDGEGLLASEAAQYQWRFGGNDINNNGNARRYNPEREGLFSVVITDENGCSRESEPFDYRIISAVGGLGVANAPRVFPNPFSDQITVQALPQGSVSIELLSILGERILVREMQNQDPAGSYSLGVGDLANGVYVLKLRAGAEFWSFKLVKR